QQQVLARRQGDRASGGFDRTGATAVRVVVAARQDVRVGSAGGDVDVARSGDELEVPHDADAGVVGQLDVARGVNRDAAQAGQDAANFHRRPGGGDVDTTGVGSSLQVADGGLQGRVAADADARLRRQRQIGDGDVGVGGIGVLNVGSREQVNFSGV